MKCNDYIYSNNNAMIKKLIEEKETRKYLRSEQSSKKTVELHCDKEPLLHYLVGDSPEKLGLVIE